MLLHFASSRQWLSQQESASAAIAANYLIMKSQLNGLIDVP